jgi:hypothetical protein
MHMLFCSHAQSLARSIRGTLHCIYIPYSYCTQSMFEENYTMHCVSVP